MKIIIHPEFINTASFIKQLPQFFEQEGELLHNGRNKVKRYRVNNKEIVVKRYKRPNIIQRIVYTFFKKSKTERAYLFAGMLREKGFDTPHEVAYIERKKNGLFWTAISCHSTALTPLYRSYCGNEISTGVQLTSWLPTWLSYTKKECFMAT